jgi:CSLREA domain-containing protein
MLRTVAPEIMWVGRARRTLSFFLLAVLVATSIGVLFMAGEAHADTFFVNSTKDRVDERPGDGLCFTGVRIVHDDGGIEGECTLRAAIQEANAVAGADTINFGILSTEDSNCNATTGVCTISPASALPTITRVATINGYSQPGASVNTATTGTNADLKIVLDGSNAGSSPSAPVDGLYVTARSTTIRGLVINNGFRAGVVFDQETPSDRGRTLEGCFIGTDALGTSAKGNGGGVIIDDGEGNVIGGTTLAARNLISGNSNAGIFISSPANGNSVQGNLIGTNKDGGKGNNLGNFTGVHIVGGSNNTIGGNGAASNTIAYNDGRHGIQVQRASDPNPGTGNRILFNSIHSNAELGIQLGAEGGTGVTPNDPDDRDVGANTLQNFPGISSAVTFGASTTITGGLNSTPNQTFTLQFFSSPEPDASGFGEGKTFIGQLNNVTTNANGNRSFTFTPAQKVPVGWRVTATATGVGGTSEFSRARLVERPVIEE